MAIDSRHTLYKQNAERWQRCRDVYEGEDAVKARGKAYLPRAEGMTDSEYNAYKERALFYEATGRTIDGFVGAISRKEPTIEAPSKLQLVIDDATADGLSLNELVKRMCAEAILQGRGGLLVDYDDKLDRPYMALYQAEAITNWFDGGVVLAETVYEPDPEDALAQVETQQLRQLGLNEGVYTVTIWRKSKANPMAAEWAVYETLTPMRRGKVLDAIPFYWLSPMGKTSRVAKPPLLGLVSVCLSHYRNSADLEHGRHFTGLPTLYVTGISDTDSPIRVGAMAAITVADPNAKIGYAEFTGQGLRSLETALEQKQQMMAVLGASVFNDGPNGVEAAETARIRTSGETSLLSGVVTAVEETIEAALTMCAEWLGVSGTINVTLNREYVDTTMDGPTLTALVSAFQAGALSLPQFLYNLQQGELLAPDTDLEEEAAIVAAEAKRRQDDALAMAQSKKPSVKA
jgi:hypothetical protein